ncbi:hypothetical protein DINM_006981 [Dirofilaria immitis]|nr:hypothetical protein [Dirofilaria immitis]
MGYCRQYQAIVGNTKPVPCIGYRLNEQHSKVTKDTNSRLSAYVINILNVRSHQRRQCFCVQTVPSCVCSLLQSTFITSETMSISLQKSCTQSCIDNNQPAIRCQPICAYTCQQACRNYQSTRVPISIIQESIQTIMPPSVPSDCMQICWPNCMLSCARRNWPTILCQQDCKKVCIESCEMASLTITPTEAPKIEFSPQYQLAISSTQTIYPSNCILQCPRSCAMNCHDDNNACKSICQQNCSKICNQQVFLTTPQPAIYRSSCMKNCPSGCISSCTSGNFPSPLCMQVCQPACTEACIPTHQPQTSYQPNFSSSASITCENRCHITCMATCREQNWSQEICSGSMRVSNNFCCIAITFTTPITPTTPAIPLFVVSPNTPIPVIDSRTCLDKCMARCSMKDCIASGQSEPACYLQCNLQCHQNCQIPSVHVSHPILQQNPLQCNDSCYEGCNQMCHNNNRYQCLPLCQMECKKQCTFPLQQSQLHLQTLTLPKMIHVNQLVIKNTCSSNNLPNEKCMILCQLQCQKVHVSSNPISQIIPSSSDNSQVPANSPCPITPTISPISNIPTIEKKTICPAICMPLCLPSCITPQVQPISIPTASKTSLLNTIAPLSPNCIMNCIDICTQQCLQFKLTINTCQSACQMQCANVC